MRLDEWVLLDMWPLKAGGVRGLYAGSLQDRPDGWGPCSPRKPFSGKWRARVAPPPTAPEAPATPPSDLAERLRLETLPDDVFNGQPRLSRDRHIFGGLLMSQALHAASRTVPGDREPHSVHGSFLQGGDGRQALRYQVERTRDGAAFSSRRVVVDQAGPWLFVATVSFHAPEPGLEYVPPPRSRPPA